MDEYMNFGPDCPNLYIKRIVRCCMYFVKFAWNMNILILNDNIDKGAMSVEP